MSEEIKLIVGLGNPGQQYQDTRHNAGAWFLEHLCKQKGTDLKPDTKVLGAHGRTDIDGCDVRLLFPTTFMNRSGGSVAAMCQYFRIPPQSVLVVYDELDLPAGTVRLKLGGGHGGHNGLRDMISALGTNDFPRLRIGIGHPGAAPLVHDYVLGVPGKTDREKIEDSITRALDVVPLICRGDTQTAMNRLHTKPD